MAQLLALEWTNSEARIVLASARGRATFQQAFSVSLQGRTLDGGNETVDPGERIAAALAARGIGRVDALVAVGRSNIELRQMSLPPGEKDELPEMVRFQSMQEFNELDESWLLDFVPLDTRPDGHRSVLAAAIGPHIAEQIQDVCARAGVKPRRLVLRPCSAASLFNHSRSARPSQLCMLVDLLDDEADLTVTLGGKVVFLRTTRLGSDPLESPDHAAALLGELRRTMAAAQNQLGGQRVDSVVLFGSDKLHEDLAATIEKNLDVESELFDPFGDLNLASELRRSLPDKPDCFAPLLGMLLDETHRRGHAIDFLHPRRPPEVKTQHLKWALAGVLGFSLLLAFFGYRYLHRQQLNADIAILKTRSEQLDKEVAAAKKLQEAVTQIEKWKSSDVVWLDELDELCREFPPAEEAMLEQLTFAPTPVGGMIDLEGRAKDANTVSEIESRLRDGGHRVSGERSSEDETNRQYPWKFDASVFVSPSDDQKPKEAKKPAMGDTPTNSGGRP